MAAGGRTGHGRADVGGLDARQPGRGRRPPTGRVYGRSVNTAAALCVVTAKSMALSRWVCAVAACLLSVLPASGQGFKWWQSERFQRELALSADQSTKLEQVFQALQPLLQTQKEALDKHEAALSRVIADPKTDEAQVLVSVERVEAARSDLARSRTLLTFRMRRILTTGQHVKMQVMHEQWTRDRRSRQPSRPPNKPGR
ncbi:MAG: periplasmic heavy metal sensor [Acidobacteria bacterium]|nr:periplasmic heavy metal sensor [Acidobacteriota bacterium]